MKLDAGNVLPVDRARARRRREIDAGDPEIAKLGQLASFAHAIVVGILPDQELTERGVLAVDHAVMVGIEARKSGNAIGKVPAREVGREQLAATFDLAGAVDVEGKDAVVAGGPGDLVLGAVSVDVELDTVADGSETDAGSVKVENNRIDMPVPD